MSQIVKLQSTMKAVIKMSKKKVKVFHEDINQILFH
jgi:hypothetical protein